MKPLPTPWSWCLAASLAVNGVAIAALGRGPSAAAARVVKAERKPPTRLMEIRLEKEAPPKEDAGKEPLGKEDKDGGSKDEETGTESERKAPNPVASTHRKIPSPPAPSPPEGRGGSRMVTNIDFGHRTLTPPKPRVVPRRDGVVDLRNVHLKGTTYADPKLLAKNQPPNKTLGKSQIKVVGKATSLAQCVGAVGGNTLMGGKMTILMGKGIDIKGTKFCVPGGVPGVPGSGQGQSGASANRPSTVATTSGPGTKAALPGANDKGGGAKGTRGLNAREGGKGEQVAFSPGQASGPVRNVDEPWVSYGYRGGGKRMGGPETDLHLPARHDDPTDRVRPATPHAKPAVRTRFEPAPVSVGSHSERGTIAWGPDSHKRRAHGLKGEYYLGNEFGRYEFTRTDPNIDFVWTNAVVDPRQPTRQPFSVRWTGFLKPDYSEVYTVSTSSDDGVRLWIDGRLVIDNWTEHAPQEDVVRIPLTAGKEVPIRLEYFEIDGLQREVIKLYWESASQPKAYVSTRNLFLSKP